MRRVLKKDTGKHSNSNFKTKVVWNFPLLNDLVYGYNSQLISNVDYDLINICWTFGLLNDLVLKNMIRFDRFDSVGFFAW